MTKQIINADALKQRIMVHPGARIEERALAVECTAYPIELKMKSGLCVNECVAQALAQIGEKSAYVRLDGVKLEPMRFVIPALAKDAEHAGWYSETYAPLGIGEIIAAGMFLGARDGVPFSHCHGLWRAADGQKHMGHLLVLEAIISEDISVSAWIMPDALMDVKHDTETNFRIFAPHLLETPQKQTNSTQRTKRALLCRVRPNENFTAQVEALCREHNFRAAELHGIGSFVDGYLRDQPLVNSIATEAFILEGRVENGMAMMRMGIVGVDGQFEIGILEPRNSIAVTFELLITEK